MTGEAPDVRSDQSSPRVILEWSQSDPRVIRVIGVIRVIMVIMVIMVIKVIRVIIASLH